MKVRITSQKQADNSIIRIKQLMAKAIGRDINTTPVLVTISIMPVISLANNLTNGEIIELIELIRALLKTNFLKKR